jgi:hypothetical protein
LTLEPHEPQALLICGFLSVDRGLLDSIENSLKTKFGEVGLRSYIFPFNWTDYYNAEMGEGILRRWLVFKKPRSLERLWNYKLESSKVEKEYSREGRRTVNIDPGFIRMDGLWLLSTKPAGHRAYLDEGVWIEMTLRFLKDRCEEMPWTYPDHRDPEAQRFLLKAREVLKKDLRNV